MKEKLKLRSKKKGATEKRTKKTDNYKTRWAKEDKTIKNKIYYKILSGQRKRRKEKQWFKFF